MAFCTECGTNVPDGIQFCTGCGKRMKEGASAPVIEAVPDEATFETQPDPIPQQTIPIPPAPTAQFQQQVVSRPQQPGFDPYQAPPYGSRYAVMSTAGYIGASIIMSIPFIGWLICIIWACGGCKNVNKRNYARSVLFFMIISAVLAVGIFFLINWMVGGVTVMLQHALNEAGISTSENASGLQGLFDMLNQLGKELPMR